MCTCIFAICSFLCTCTCTSLEGPRVDGSVTCTSLEGPRVDGSVTCTMQRPTSAADSSSGEVIRRSSPRKKLQTNADSAYADAVGLARRLYMMDGYRKSEVAEKLADM